MIYIMKKFNLKMSEMIIKNINSENVYIYQNFKISTFNLNFFMKFSGGYLLTI